MKTFCGIVQKGKGEGARIGFPTANLPIAVTGDLRHGVYAAMVQCENEEVWRRAIVNIGAHPTLPEGLPTVEIHILDYAATLIWQTATPAPGVLRPPGTAV